MGTLAKVVIAAAAGTFLAEYVEPKLSEFVKPESETAKKGIKAVAAGASAGGIYWALSKLT